MVPYDRVSVVDLQTLFEVRFISFFSYSTSYIQLDVVINLYVGWLVTLIDKLQLTTLINWELVWAPTKKSKTSKVSITVIEAIKWLTK